MTRHCRNVKRESTLTFHASRFIFHVQTSISGNRSRIQRHNRSSSSGCKRRRTTKRCTASSNSSQSSNGGSGTGWQRSKRPSVCTHARARESQADFGQIRYSNCVILREAHMRRPSSFQFDGNLNVDCPRFKSPLSELTDVIQPPVSSATTRCEGKFNQTSPMRRAKLRAGVQITSSHIFTGSAN